VSSGTSTPISGFPIEAPLNGLFDAQTDERAPGGTHVLLQRFAIPPAATSVTLSFVVIRNNRDGGPFCPGPLDFTVVPNQCDRVDILTASANPFDTGAGVVMNIFTGALDIPANGTEIWHVFTVPLAGLAPAMYQLRFAETDNQGFNQMGVDNVSINANVAAIPEPVTWLLLTAGFVGLGAYGRLVSGRGQRSRVRVKPVLPIALRRTRHRFRISV
jgi:hypothetical protein